MAALLWFDDGPRPGDVNMHRDAALLRLCGPDDDPVLRLYRWSPPAVSLGWHQKADEFDAALVAARGYGLVRRPTGGRAILHADELTYAVVAPVPSPVFGRTLHDAYAAINAGLLRFLEEIGVRPSVARGETLAEARGLVCFRSSGRHELLIGGRKIVGSAQRRTEHAFLQHGSLLTGPGHAELVELLAPSRRTAQTREGLLAVTTDLGRECGRALAEPDLAALARRLAAAMAAALRLEAREIEAPAL